MVKAVLCHNVCKRRVLAKLVMTNSMHIHSYVMYLHA